MTGDKSINGRVLVLSTGFMTTGAGKAGAVSVEGLSQQVERANKIQTLMALTTWKQMLNNKLTQVNIIKC